MSRAERDAAYNNAAAVAESAQHIARWTAAHCSALETMRYTVNICASTLDAPTGHSSPSTGRKPARAAVTQLPTLSRCGASDTSFFISFNESDLSFAA
jgi:hypothetical protein